MVKVLSFILLEGLPANGWELQLETDPPFGGNLRCPFWTAVWVTFFVLSPRTCLTTSIEPSLYSLLTENSARGSVRFSDRLGADAS